MDAWGIMDGAMAGSSVCILITRLVLKEDGFKIKAVSAATIALMEVSITGRFGLKFRIKIPSKENGVIAMPHLTLIGEDG